MAVKEDIIDWVKEALIENNGRGTIVQVAKYIWDNYEDELRNSGDLFFTWQYEMRWAAFQLRRKGILRPQELSIRGVWILE